VSGPAADSLEAFVRAMPKVELHVHLVGSVRDGGAGRTFGSFAGFASSYGARSRSLRTGADLEAATVELGRALAASRVRYAEVTITPLSHLDAGIEPDELGESLSTGGRRALDESGVHLAWVFDISGDLGPRAGAETVRWVENHAPQGTVGFGLGGPETGVPRAWFADAFARAIGLGLHSVPHAGETDGPASVRSALDHLRAERIGHGFRSADDAELLRRLAAEAIPLEVCPTSNVRTGAVRELAEHPLPRLLEAGVPVTLATDNPAIFGIDLSHEYLLAHERFGLSRHELLGIAATGVEAAFCPPALRRELAAELQRFAATAGTAPARLGARSYAPGI
jgi:aminodeoxyfutalosine deaminase